jgi:DNA-binding NtrC family response regulator
MTGMHQAGGSARARPADDCAAAHTFTILVVDDEALIRWSLSERLRSEGCTVIEAEDGRRALECANERIDLAVLDYRLPDTDGLTLLARLRARQPRLRAMLLTAYATPETAQQAVDAGFFDLVRKPFDLDDIARMVRGALQPDVEPGH